MPHNINSDRMFLPNALLLGEVEKTLADGRSVALNATGNSMLPFIIGGYDTVFIRPQFQAGQLRVGHIVLAHLPDNRYVLHRIVSISDTEVVLMGDGNIHVTECCFNKNFCFSMSLCQCSTTLPLYPERNKARHAIGSGWCT